MQVSNHLRKVNREAVFAALYSTVNEWGELCSIQFTATKAHDQYMPALVHIPHSLCKYGHGNVQLVFTDNVRADKLELECAIPSLLKDIEPVPSSSLDPLTIPND